MTDRPLRLGVNIDHVATVRNARGSAYPDPVRAAKLAESAGADGITAHLREDRRHISDRDIDRLMAELTLPLNLEMAATDDMLKIALHHRPQAVCIVPERREERTTERGLAVAGRVERLVPVIEPLAKAGCRVSLFIEPDGEQVAAAREAGAAVVEFHTGTYCDAHHDNRVIDRDRETRRIHEAAQLALSVGLEVHAGHGLTFETVGPIAAMPQISELNIGHFLIGESIFLGLKSAITCMRKHMDEARAGQ